jgi:hypothetical protein
MSPTGGSTELEAGNSSRSKNHGILQGRLAGLAEPSARTYVPLHQTGMDGVVALPIESTGGRSESFRIACSSEW